METLEDLMAAVEIRMGTQGRLVLPRELREQLAAEEGSVYVATVAGEGRLLLETREAVLERMRARVAGTGEGSVVDELIRERRAEAAAEAKG